MTRPVAGLDGCPDGWLYVLEVGNGQLEAGIAGDVSAVLRIVPGDTIVAIDIPIGLTEAGGRACDAAAPPARLAATSQRVLLARARRPGHRHVP